jgi:hypothetical protein
LFNKLLHLLNYLVQLLSRCAAVRSDSTDISGDLIFERSDTDLIELIEIAAENCGELASLKQFNFGISSKRQHACIEIEPAQLPINDSCIDS